MWILIIVICLIFPMLATPVNGIIKRRIHKPWLSYLVQLLVDCAILSIILVLTHLLGFDINR